MSPGQLNGIHPDDERPATGPYRSIVNNHQYYCSRSLADLEATPAMALSDRSIAIVATGFSMGIVLLESRPSLESSGD